MKFVLVIVFAFTTLSLFGQSNDVDLVKKAFADYKSAILNDQAEKALSVVDSRTKKYYTQILNDVKSADSAKINSLSIVDKITILGIRSKASKDEILKMKETDAFIFAVNNGMVGKNSVAGNSVGQITIDGKFAKAQLVASGQATDLYFNFYNEDKQWKLDLTALFPLTKQVFKKMIDDSGKSENEFLFNILEVLTGKKITSEIWKPIM